MLPCCTAAFDTLRMPVVTDHPCADVRRAVFCTLMGATDFADAFEKLTKLELKGQQDREVHTVNDVAFLVARVRRPNQLALIALNV